MSFLAPALRQARLNATLLARVSTWPRFSSDSAILPKSKNKEVLKKDDVVSNPFFDKYSAKLQEAFEKKQEFERLKASATAIPGLVKPEAKKSSEAAAPATPQYKPSGAPPGARSLNSILNLDMVAELTGQEIGHIWNEFHVKKDGISACIPADRYKVLAANGKVVLCDDRSALIRTGLSEFADRQCGITSLLEYKNAPTVLMMTFYTDLLDSKGIVLMHGEVTDKISALDAQCLANQINMYYLGTEDAFALVRTFNHKPAQFDHQKLIQRLENLTGAPTASK